jgi:hypothetical protein
MGALLLVSYPAKRMDGPAHRSSTHVHPMLSFPPLTILLLTRIGVRFQQLLHSHAQRRPFFRGSPGNGPWQNRSCFAPLLHIALNGGPRYLEEINDFCPRCPIVNCTKDLLSYILRICSHASIVSPGSLFQQAARVHKLPVVNCTGIGRHCHDHQKKR